MGNSITLTELSKKFETFYDEFRKERRKYMDTSGDKMEAQVKANIATSVNDSEGQLTAPLR